MSSDAKQKLHELLDSLPDDMPMDQLLKSLELLSALHEGIEDAEAGRLVTIEEVREQLSSWKATQSG